VLRIFDLLSEDVRNAPLSVDVLDIQLTTLLSESSNAELTHVNISEFLGDGNPFGPIDASALPRESTAPMVANNGAMKLIGGTLARGNGDSAVKSVRIRRFGSFLRWQAASSCCLARVLQYDSRS
jgi:hypothetical protein